MQDKISLQTLLNDYECVQIDEHDDGSSTLHLESPTNEDVLGIQISLPTEVVQKYDLRMWYGRNRQKN